MFSGLRQLSLTCSGEAEPGGFPKLMKVLVGPIFRFAQGRNEHHYLRHHAIPLSGGGAEMRPVSVSKI